MQERRQRHFSQLPRSSAALQHRRRGKRDALQKARFGFGRRPSENEPRQRRPGRRGFRHHGGHERPPEQDRVRRHHDKTLGRRRLFRQRGFYEARFCGQQEKLPRDSRVGKQKVQLGAVAFESEQAWKLPGVRERDGKKKLYIGSAPLLRGQPGSAKHVRQLEDQRARLSGARGRNLHFDRRLRQNERRGGGGGQQQGQHFANLRRDGRGEGRGARGSGAAVGGVQGELDLPGGQPQDGAFGAEPHPHRGHFERNVVLPRRVLVQKGMVAAGGVREAVRLQLGTASGILFKQMQAGRRCEALL